MIIFNFAAPQGQFRDLNPGVAEYIQLKILLRNKRFDGVL